jgi:hypothetical protein
MLEVDKVLEDIPFDSIVEELPESVPRYLIIIIIVILIIIILRLTIIYCLFIYLFIYLLIYLFIYYLFIYFLCFVRFIAYSYELKHDDGRVSYPLVFIFYCPNTTPNWNMLYSSAKTRLTNALKIMKVCTLFYFLFLFVFVC